MAELTRLEVIKLIAVAEEVNLTGVDLSGLDLSRLDLTSANLSGADLEGSYLVDTILNEAILFLANLRGANLSYAKLHNSNLTFCDLRGADLEAALLSGAYLEGALLSGANLEGANLYNADLKKVDLTEVKNYTMKIDERHLRISKIINGYYEQLNRDELTDKDFKLWIESLREPMREHFRKQGLDNCRGVLNFQRFILELQDKGLGEYMRENLTEEDFRYWKADK